MADIVFKYPEMRTAVTAIEGYSSDYKTAAGAFESDFLSAINAWEGTSKDKMQAFITGPVKDFIAETVPQLVTGLSQMLAANADQMESADQQIADNIPSSLG